MRQGAGAVGAGDGPVPVGLVEVQEDPLTALLLPPRRGHLVRHPPFHLAGRGDHGVPDVQELARRLDRGINVQAAVA